MLYKIPEEELEVEIEKIRGSEKKRDKNITKVCEITGESRTVVRNRMKMAKEEYGISFKEYVKYALYDIPDEKLDVEVGIIKRNKERIIKRKAERYKIIMEATGWTEEKTAKVLEEIRKKYGINGYSFVENKLYEYEGKEFESRVEQILEQKEKIENEEKIEAEAVFARRKFISEDKCLVSIKSPLSIEYLIKNDLLIAYSDDDTLSPTYENCSEDRHVKPIIAACYYLGIPLPVGALSKYQPSSYVEKMQGELDEIRFILGKNIVPDTSITVNEYLNFKRKFMNQNTALYNETDLAIFYTDWLLFGKDYGFSLDDYFEYEFYNKEIDVRNTFLSEGYRSWVKQVCNRDMRLLMDKVEFNSFFKTLIARDWLDMTNSTREQLEDFVEKHPVFFSKPITGTGGKGAGIIDSSIMTKDELFEITQGCIIEEVIKQHKEMAEFNESSLNTLRMYSLVDANDEAIITGCIARFGLKGMHVDNFHSGGMCGMVDVETGKLVTKCKNIKNETFEKHPDSGKSYIGFAIPKWEEVKEFVNKSALMCKDINRHIGWDIAILDNGKVDIVEGNSRPNFDVLQMDQKGKMSIYEKHMNELAQKLGKDKYEVVTLDIDISKKLVK